MNEWIVSEAEAGLSVLEFLRQRIPEAPSAYLRQLLRSGKIRLEGWPLAVDSRLPAGARLTLPDSRRLAEFRQAADKTVVLLAETASLIAVLKPAGLAVHRGVGHEEDNLTDRVRALMRRRREPFKVAPVHRLDAETSGPVLFGKGTRAIAGLGKQFMERQVEKVYLALVAGQMPTTGLLTSPVPAKEKLKNALTAFRTLAAGGGWSLLELRLQTGRTHQIRRQLADAGHPIAGDARYRGPTPADLNRLFLHCSRLSMRDPFTQLVLCIVSELPAELVAVLTGLGIDVHKTCTSGQRQSPDPLLPLG